MAGGSALGSTTASWAAYRPSALDRLVDAVARLPGWPPMAYLVLGAGGVVLLHAVRVVDGSLEAGAISAPLVSFGTWGPLVLAAKALMRRTARHSVDGFRPALRGDDRDCDAIRYRLMTQPLFGTWLGGLGFIGFAAPATFLSEHYVRTTGLFTSPAAVALQLPLLVFYLWVTGAAGYGIVHTLVTVHGVYVRRARVDVLRPEPLYALSRLTSFSAMAVLLVQYNWIAGNPAILRSPAALANILTWDALALVLFVWPLWGAHRMLADAKSALLGEVGMRVERAGAELRRAVDEDATARMAPLKDALLGLESSLRVVERASTWPWQPETPRLVVSAVLLPLGAWLLQQVLDRVLL
ncbi:MAG: hypothetical protein P8Y02_03705 [Deinococcales bacterium]